MNIELHLIILIIALYGWAHNLAQPAPGKVWVTDDEEESAASPTQGSHAG